jgi:ketosteroid isomerase-like protein
MKKTLCLVIAIALAGMNAYSQKKSGTVYSEHEAIGKTRELWKAFLNGDKETFRSFFADSAYILSNGEGSPKLANDQIGRNIDFFQNNFTDMSIEDEKPAFPDAIEYKEGGVWVQDWLIMKGIHTKTGVVLNLPMHTIYAFDEEGKITLMVRYFDNDVFQEIFEAQTTRENGKVYIHHPYIASVRKMMNAFLAGDLEEWKTYFSENAVFSELSQPFGTTMNMEQEIEMLTKLVGNGGAKFKVEQMGYPDCIYYEQSNAYVVYSWWKVTTKSEGKPYSFSIMMSHDFDDEGKIVRESFYGSSNNLQKLWQ